MHAHTFTNAKGVWVRVSKAVARKAWADGAMILICPAGHNPGAASTVFKMRPAGDIDISLDSMVRVFEAGYCRSKDSGQRAAYYLLGYQSAVGLKPLEMRSAESEVTSQLNANERPGLAVEAEIREHMAKAFFASAWADLQEEKDADDETSVNLSGKEIMEVMPNEIDPAAVHAARTLTIAVLTANYGIDAKNRSLSILLECVREVQTATNTHGDRPVNAEMFGHYLAMQAMGHGVGLYDAFGKAVYDAIKVPYVQFGSYSLEKDY